MMIIYFNFYQTSESKEEEEEENNNKEEETDRGEKRHGLLFVAMFAQKCRSEELLRSSDGLDIVEESSSAPPRRLFVKTLSTWSMSNNSGGNNQNGRGADVPSQMVQLLPGRGVATKGCCRRQRHLHPHLHHNHQLQR
ncbi:Uncharacterized protein TSPI_08648 [Trichinella spiralis]|uniref:Uncharacterized protein n=1 Tax=Trichinella spiralis TaxID=6334 RepID=A0ABR3K3B9_TRISP